MGFIYKCLYIGSTTNVILRVAFDWMVELYVRMVFVEWLVPSGSYVSHKNNDDNGSKGNRHVYGSKKQKPYWPEEKK